MRLMTIWDAMMEAEVDRDELGKHWCKYGNERDGRLSLIIRRQRQFWKFRTHLRHRLSAIDAATWGDS